MSTLSLQELFDRLRFISKANASEKQRAKPLKDFLKSIDLTVYPKWLRRFVRLALLQGTQSESRKAYISSALYHEDLQIWQDNFFGKLHCQNCGCLLSTKSWRVAPKMYCSLKCVSSSSSVKNKKILTNRKNRGVDNPSQASDVKRKKMQKELDKSGGKYIYPTQNPKTVARIRAVSAKKGCSWPTQFSEHRESVQNTVMAVYGVRNVMQDPEIFKRQQKASYTVKTFIDKNGKKHYCRGYEPFVLAYLDSHPNVKRFTTVVNTKLLPIVGYTGLTGLDSVYYPDIGVELFDGRTLMIEVKGNHFLKRNVEEETTNRKKFQAASKETGNFWMALVRPHRNSITWETSKIVKETGLRHE